MVAECDVRDCPARAAVTVVLRTGTLTLCRHHYGEVRQALPADAVVSEDKDPRGPEQAAPRRNHYQDMLAAMRAERERE